MTISKKARFQSRKVRWLLVKPNFWIAHQCSTSSQIKYTLCQTQTAVKVLPSLSARMRLKCSLKIPKGITNQSTTKISMTSWWAGKINTETYQQASHIALTLSRLIKTLKLYSKLKMTRLDSISWRQQGRPQLQRRSQSRIQIQA